MYYLISMKAATRQKREVDFKQVWSAASFHFKGSGGSKAAVATQTACTAACYEPQEPPDSGEFRENAEPELVCTSGSGSHLTSYSERNQRRLASCGSAAATSSPAAALAGCTLAPRRQLPEPMCDRVVFTVSRDQRLER